ncbi:ABC transporter family substrate-binding protein [Georgenia sp. Z1491]|uniref:ABC transporter family substrate-binding protein n=1 Tax=Georgenia sp. Z1491 TaxID=3416707 RepID=UPI003CF86355
MKIRRFTGLVAASAATALVLAACGGSSDEDDNGGDDDTTQTDGAGGDDPDAPDDDPDAGGDAAGLNESTQISLGWNQHFYEYNDNTSTGNATANANILYLMNDRFAYFDENLEFVRNEDFGTMELAEDEVTVTWTIADGVTWSDGTPVSAVDVLLQWAATSGHLNTVEEELDEEGEVTNQEEVDAGVFFNGTSPTVAYFQPTPEISDDYTTLTAELSEPFADWEFQLASGFIPAHVVAMRALDIDDPQEALDTLVEAIQTNDAEVLAPVSTFWNEGFQFDGTLPDDELLYLSNGPYLLSEISGEEYVVLTANPDYTGANQAAFETVTVRFNGDPNALVDAMENQEIAVVSPQPTSDLLTRVEGLGEPYTFSQEDTATYEHVDLAQNNEGPFDPATYGGDEETARNVREAFLRVIPRQDILDQLVIPLNPDAQIRNSQTQVPGSPNYDAIVEANGMTSYDEPDVELATQLLEEAGVETPIEVRFMYDTANTRRSNTFQLLASAYEESGLFTLVDAGSTDWGSLLSDTNVYDAALFGWQSTSTGATNAQASFYTDGINNFYGYSNPEVDALWDQIAVAVDTDEQAELLGQMEAHLVEDAFGLVLYQHPGLTAWNSDVVEEITPITMSPTIFWNFWEWTPGGAAAAS